jgi:hypothetical protein
MLVITTNMHDVSVGGLWLRIRNILWNIQYSSIGHGFYSIQPPTNFDSPLAIIGQSKSATWHSLIGPCVMLSLVHLSTTSSSIHLPHEASTSSYGFHVIHTDDTWHFFIGPHGPPKIPFSGDTWKLVVLPRHHVDVNMMSYISCMTYMDRPHGSLWS